tara:strand:- start:434 stop:568 length:135 start_codon:yes stop_codon:yes gene_type:complete
MNPALAYLLGLLTSLLVIFPFWYAGTKDDATRDTYNDIFCRDSF